jgi:hypothetical protein
MDGSVLVNAVDRCEYEFTLIAFVSSRPRGSYGIGVCHVCPFVHSSHCCLRDNELADFDQTSPVDLYTFTLSRMSLIINKFRRYILRISGTILQGD